MIRRRTFIAAAVAAVFTPAAQPVRQLTVADVRRITRRMRELNGTAVQAGWVHINSYGTWGWPGDTLPVSPMEIGHFDGVRFIVSPMQE